jgi:hypothetical protein
MMAQTDEFGRHEVLHTAHIIASNFEEFICDHGYVLSDAELQRAAEEMLERLGAFYELVGDRNDAKDKE